MNFDEDRILSTLNESWNWLMPKVEKVLAVNSMGNCFVQDRNSHYWRVCPENLCSEVVAKNDEELQSVFNDPNFKEDWQLLGLIDPAEEHLGELESDECYAMVIPAVLGGEYSVANLRVGSIYEYLSLSGEMAFKTKNLKDGDQVELCIT